MNRRRETVAVAYLFGFSLVELLIATLLGTLLSLAMTTVYLTAARQFRINDSLARMQESGRFALQLIDRELSMAGFLGVRYQQTEIPSQAVSGDCVASGDWALSVSPALDHINQFDADGSEPLRTAGGAVLSCIDPALIVPGSDILIVKRTAGDYTLRAGSLVPAAPVRDNQWYLRIADFGQDVGWYYHLSGNLPAADLTPGLAVDYWAYNVRILYLRNYSETPGDDIPSLCMEGLAGGGALGTMTTRCLVEGVEDLQIEFVVDSDGDGTPNRYLSEPTAADLSQAKAVRVFLLQRSLDELPITDEQVSYSLGENQRVLGGAYLRRVFSATVAVHNAL